MAFRVSRVLAVAIVTAAAAALPGLARAGAPYYGIQVNGACDVGSCDFSNPVPLNTNSTTQSINIPITLSDGDQYLITGSATAYNNYNGGYLPEGLVYQVTYEGDGVPGQATLGTDTISVNSFLSTVDTCCGYGNFDAGAVGYLSPGLGTGSSAEYSGYGDGLDGPALQGPVTATGGFNLDYTNTMDAANGEFEFEISSVSVFGTGTAVGAEMTFGQETPLTPVPEPVSITLLGAGLGVLGLIRCRKA